MTPFELGYDAFLRGEYDTENPYVRIYEKDDFDSWLDGWCAAARDHEEGR